MGSGSVLEKFDQGDNQAALGDQRTEHPFQKFGLQRRDVRLGRQIGVEQRHMLFGQGLGRFSVKPLSVNRLTNR